MCVMMTEIKTIDGGQKDALLKTANIKKFILYGIRFDLKHLKPL